MQSLLKNYSTSVVQSILILPIEDYSADPLVNTAEIYNKITLLVHNDKRFKIIDRSNLDKILNEQQLQMTGITSPESSIKIGNVAGAKLILATRIEQGIMEYKIIKVETSEVVAYEFTKISDEKGYDPTKAGSGPPIIRTGWIPSDRYQRYFDEKLKIGYYPVEIRGRNYNGWSQYYGVYKLNKAGIPWVTHHGITKYLFDQKVKDYAIQGFKVVFTHTFKDDTGTERFNAIWYPK